MPRKRVNIFNELKQALEEVQEYRQGKRTDLRVTVLPSPPKEVSPKEIRRIRRRLNASQAVFAQYLNVTANAVRSWEQGTRKSQQAALKLLVIARKNPKADGLAAAASNHDLAADPAAPARSRLRVFRLKAAPIQQTHFSLATEARTAPFALHSLLPPASDEPFLFHKSYKRVYKH